MNQLEQKVDDFLKAKNALESDDQTFIAGEYTLLISRAENGDCFVMKSCVEEKKSRLSNSYEFVFIPVGSKHDQSLSFYLEEHFAHGPDETLLSVKAQYHNYSGDLKKVHGVVSLDDSDENDGFEEENDYGRGFHQSGLMTGYMRPSGKLLVEEKCPIKINLEQVAESIVVSFQDRDGNELYKHTVPQQNLPIGQRLDKLLSEFL